MCYDQTDEGPGSVPADERWVAVESGSHIARCQECIDLLVDYLEGELSAERARALDVHLELCPACVRFVRTYKGTVNVARTLPLDEIPPELTQRLLDFLRKEKEGRLPPASP